MSDLPRVLNRERAAEYCGVSPDGFSAWVRIGRMPAAIAGTRRWDRKALDAALDKLSGLGVVADSKSALDAWKAGKDA